MYEYKYINVETGASSFSNKADAEYRTIIDCEAEEGWRYVGYLPTRYSGYGLIKELDLIFEREKK
ncbi:MAG: DUF4177 domain-containing protein [Oscillospiraceae bacterium]|jgi:hypothetical protein|nr:DUF4177 domain-containing protein [Oscillospiraceae bacterium]MBQ1619867.1 DUF4177 domain-containing protein [Oscillospiraceae bacterium]MBQ1805005.1 DUF4177 domain-containing protein [Oscillospiraceae bacterium]MBQ1834394.1 DUF4177 domain-containing protein [Oscillospiraceae bacterium]MBQ2224290.1 DUF4177 domain-containing protein [Oscillospiraceae bacterium]